MEVIRETLWKRCLSTPIKPPAKSSYICLSETAYQHKGTRRKCKKTNQAAIIQWQRQCIMDKPHCKPWPKSKTNDISKQSPSPLHHTFLLGRARFTAQPLSALVLPLVSPRNDAWETSAEIPYWWRVTTQVRIVILIGRPTREMCFNQLEALTLTSSVWNFCACPSDVISRGNQR